MVASAIQAMEEHWEMRCRRCGSPKKRWSTSAGVVTPTPAIVRFLASAGDLESRIRELEQLH